MTNPINPFNRPAANPVNNSTGKSQSKDSTEAPASSGNAAVEDTVSLSPGSQQVIELQQRLNNTPEIDSVKVEAIKQEIAKGNYPLDPEKIAENLINLEQSLIE